MSTSTRFTVAIHILTLLANASGEALTSEFIASSVNTNAVVIRRLLGLLREAGLVVSQGGPGGGWQLSRLDKSITLRAIYRAVEGSTLFPLHSSTPNPRCPVGSTIQTALTGHFEAAQQALEKDLERTTVADLLRQLRARSR
jgi:Rrf2 family protein